MSFNENFEMRLVEARHYIDIGQAEKAESILHELLAEDPKDSEALYLLAYSQYTLDRDEQALATCLEGMNLGDSLEDFYSLRGKIHFSLDQLPEAEECFLEALRLDPSNAAILANYGYLMLRTGHEKKAAKLIEEALRIDPEDPAVLHYAFYYFLAKNKKHEEMAALSDYIQVASNEVGILVKAGTADLVRGNTREAREKFRQAYVLDPKNKSILETLESLDEDYHIVFLPHRIMSKLGGPIAVWVEFLVLMAVLRHFKLYSIAGPIAIGYLIFCIYTWVAPCIYKAIKGK